MKERIKKIWIIFLIGFGTTAMYSLPYMKSVFYDPMREALNLSHHQLGNLLSIYGIVALLSYLPGGYIADNYPIKKLVSFSLISTGILGFWMASCPNYSILCIVFFLYGITTVLTYFSAVIKVIRMLGDSSEQGRVFGFYEGVGGAVGTLLSLLGFYFFSKYSDIVTGFKATTMMYSIASILVGIILYIVLKEKKLEEREKLNKTNKINELSLLDIIKIPKVWLMSAIIFSVYIVFSSLTYLNPYMKEVFKAPLSLISLIAIFRTYFVKIIASPVAGVIADRIGSSTKLIFLGFILAAIIQGFFLITPGIPELMHVTFISMLILTILMFAFRGIYFAIIDEANIPINITGKVVGLISIIGFLPDAFYYTLVGRWLDKHGNIAYEYIFDLSLGFSILGIISSFILLIILKNEKKNEIIYVNRITL